MSKQTRRILYLKCSASVLWLRNVLGISGEEEGRRIPPVSWPTLETSSCRKIRFLLINMSLKGRKSCVPLLPPPRKNPGVVSAEHTTAKNTS